VRIFTRRGFRRDPDYQGSRIFSFLEEVMFWWMPFLPLFDPFNVASDQRQYADEKQSDQRDNRKRPQPKSPPKAKRKASSKRLEKAAGGKGAARKSARKKGAKRRR
jgi:hypothetical protein